jgi:glycosyltransferase involved in cell wall biosynthesis
MLMDYLKGIGNKITILYDPSVRNHEIRKDLNLIRKYHPVEQLSSSDFTPIADLPQGYPYGGFSGTMRRTISRADCLFTELTTYLKIPEHISVQKHIHYLHYPSIHVPLEGTTVIANSTFTQEKAREMWGIKMDVLHPPLYLNRYSSSEEKEYDICIEDRNPLLMGSGKTEVISMLDRPHLIFLNPTFEQYINYLSKSRVYIHMKVNEHFGISVSEAMACGIPVIVHKSGGPYTDIIDKGEYGLFYETREDLRLCIERLCFMDAQVDYSKKSLERSHIFSIENNKHKINRLFGV